MLVVAPLSRVSSLAGFSCPRDVLDKCSLSTLCLHIVRGGQNSFADCFRSSGWPTLFAPCASRSGWKGRCITTMQCASPEWYPFSIPRLLPWPLARTSCLPLPINATPSLPCSNIPFSLCAHALIWDCAERVGDLHSMACAYGYPDGVANGQNTTVLDTEQPHVHCLLLGKENVQLANHPKLHCATHKVRSTEHALPKTCVQGNAATHRIQWMWLLTPYLSHFLYRMNPLALQGPHCVIVSIRLLWGFCAEESKSSSTNAQFFRCPGGGGLLCNGGGNQSIAPCPAPCKPMHKVRW